MTSKSMWRTGVILVGTLLLVSALAGCSDDTGSTCPTGQVTCNGKCVSTASDPANCGACGTACAADQSCVNGKCGCSGTQITCNGKCTDPNRDVLNCGACGTACKTGEVCDTGKCTSTCAAPKTVCDGACVDLQSDATNCGACGTKCDATAGLGCVAGKCACTQTGMTNCSNKCVSTATDPANCGACGTKCAAGETCTNGKCVPGQSCVAPKLNCSGSCIDPLSDNANCGACGSKCDTAAGFSCVAGKCACIAGLTECSGKCVNTAIDGANCGTCGKNCGTGVGCVGGVCSACPTGQILCAGKCVDPKADPNNCSAATPPVCGIACTGGKACAAGICTCPAGTNDCSGTCSNFNTDPLHCGNCTTACPTGQPCVAGKCGVCPTGQLSCGSPPLCVTTATDINNCGACGTKCTGGMTCQNSVCACPTTLPNNCSGTCVNFQTDDLHCGTCTNVCTGNQICAAGVCTASPVIAVAVACGTQPTIPELIEVQCSATATLQNGKTVDVTTDPKFTWTLTGCGTINYTSTTTAKPGNYKAGAVGACTVDPIISGSYSGPPVVNANNATLHVVASTLTGISIFPGSPKLPRITGMTVDFTLMCTYNNGLTVACPNQAGVAWTSSNTALPVVGTTGVFPTGGFTGAMSGATTIQATWNPGGGATDLTATTVVTVVGDTLGSITVQPATITKSRGQTFGFKVIANFNTSDTFDITELCTGTLYSGCGASLSLALAAVGGTTYVTNGAGNAFSGAGADVNTTTHEFTGIAQNVTPANLPETVRATFTYGTAVQTADLKVTVSGAVLTSCYVTNAADEATAPAGPPATPRTKDYAAGQTGVQFKAWGYYSAGAPQDITTSVAWSSSAPTIATVSTATGHQGESNMVAAGTANIIANPTALQAGVANCTYVAVVKAGTLCSLKIVPVYRGVAGRRTYKNTASTTGDPAFAYNPTTEPITISGDDPLLPNAAGWSQQFMAIAKYSTTTCPANTFPVDVTARATWSVAAADAKPVALAAAGTAGLYNVSPNTTDGNERRLSTVTAILTDPAGSTTTASDTIAPVVCGTFVPNSLQVDRVFSPTVAESTTILNLTLGAKASTFLRAKFADQETTGSAVECVAGWGAATGYLLDITEDATNFTTVPGNDGTAVTVSTTANTRGEVTGTVTGTNPATVFGYLGAVPSAPLQVAVGNATINSCVITPAATSAVVSQAQGTYPAIPATIQFTARATLSNGATNVDVTDKVFWSQTGCTSIGLNTGILSATAAGTCKIVAWTGAGGTGVQCTPIPPAEPYVTVTAATITGMFIQTSDKTCFDPAPTAPLLLTANTRTDLYGCLTYNNGGRVAFDLGATDDANFTWNSATPTVATINTTGLVTATAVPGTSVVTATYSTTVPPTTATLNVTVTATPITSIALQGINLGATGCNLLNTTGTGAITMEACEMTATTVAYRVIGTRAGGTQDLTDMVTFPGSPIAGVGGAALTQVAGFPGRYTVAGGSATPGTSYVNLSASVTIGANPQLDTPVVTVAVLPNTLVSTVAVTAAPSATITGLGNAAKLKTMGTVPVTGGNVTLDLSMGTNYAHETLINGGHANVAFIYAVPNNPVNGWVISHATGTTVVKASTVGATSGTITFTVN